LRGQGLFILVVCVFGFVATLMLGIIIALETI